MRGASLGAAVTLALGIGACTAIFSFVNPLLLHPFTYPRPEELLMIQERDPRGNPAQVSYPDYRDWSSQADAFSGMAAFDIGFFFLTGVEEPEQIAGALVTPNLFRVLRVGPVLGRDFRDDDDRVVILTDAAWKRRFAGNPNILGRTIALDFARTTEIERYTVIGVMPPNFWMYYGGFEVFVPLAPGAIRDDRKARMLFAIGRRNEGVSVEQAQGALSAIPIEKDWGVLVTPWYKAASQPVRAELLVMAGAAGLLLMIASANAAGLLLVRAQARRMEIAVRTALGASPWRLVRLFAGESLRIGLAAAMLGSLLAWWGVRTMIALLPQGLAATQFLAGLDRVAVDAPALSFAAAIAVAACLGAGVLPAWQARNAHLMSSLKGTGSVESHRARKTLVMVEVALSVVLLAGAGLLIKTLERIRAIDLGFRAEKLLVMRVPMPSGQAADRARAASYYQELAARVRALPGVRSAALANFQPLTGAHRSEEFRIPGHEEKFRAGYQVVLPDYFATLGIALRRGRYLNAQDERRVVINETMARRYWPQDDPVGRSIRVAGDALEIVGVVADVRTRLMSKPEPLVYRPFRDEPARAQQMAVRTEGDPLGLAHAVRGVVRDLGGTVAEVSTMESFVENDAWQQKQAAALLAVFAGLAFVLSTVGLYGVISFAVGQRTREIGIRVAVGARRGDVIRLVLRQGIGPVVAGLVIGLSAALALSRLLVGLLYELAPFDPAVLAGVVMAIGGAALVGCWLPARRALAVDPVAALWCD